MYVGVSRLLQEHESCLLMKLHYYRESLCLLVYEHKLGAVACIRYMYVSGNSLLLLGAVKVHHHENMSM